MTTQKRGCILKYLRTEATDFKISPSKMGEIQAESLEKVSKPNRRSFPDDKSLHICFEYYVNISVEMMSRPIS